jgi:hypothetical protein
VTIRVELPQHLCQLAGVRRQVELQIAVPVTQRTLLDALETAYPMLRGTVRDPATQRRRAFLRFFACQEDLSHADPDEELPARVLDGAETFIILGAIAGG